MKEGFSAEPKSIWDGERIMWLLEEISYTDPDGKTWVVPTNQNTKAFLNGATIPRPLWSAIGSPYAGKYRRASVIHDYHVGEGSNPPVSDEHRKEADIMFYHACIFDGCTKYFSGLLYIGVTIGTIITTWSDEYKNAVLGEKEEWVRDSKEYKEILKLFWKIVDKSDKAIKKGNLQKIDKTILKQTGRMLKKVEKRNKVKNKK